MGIKISELTSATSLTGSEELPIVQAGNTKKSTISQVKAQNYSTTEQVIGTWIDGKPLYRKVIQLTTLPNNTTKTFAHSISNLEFVAKAYCVMYWPRSKRTGKPTTLYVRNKHNDYFILG